ncbi:MAG: tetratricopeptide repeat protein, partial [Myxococcales bacterium]|nr:tetratricopeptide repeat protein [Myxococcales bacterium]
VDVEALRAQIKPPEDPEAAALVDAIRDELGRTSVYKHAGKFREGVALARDLRQRAQAVDYPPLLSRALLAEGDLEMELGEHEAAARDLHASMLLALEVGDAEIASEAIAKWFYVTGAQLGRADEVAPLEPLVLALARRQRERSSIPALAYNNVGAVHYRAGDLQGAQDGFRAALEIWESLDEPNPLEVAATLNNLGVTLSDREQHERSAQHLTRALAMIELEVGEQHPNLAFPLFGLAHAELELGRLDDAELKFRRAIALLERDQGPDAFPLVYPLSGLGQLALRRGEHGAAREAFVRALAIWGARDVIDRDKGDALCGYAAALRSTGEVTEASEAEGEAARLFTAVPQPGAPARCPHLETAAPQP